MLIYVQIKIQEKKVNQILLKKTAISKIVYCNIKKVFYKQHIIYKQHIQVSE